MIVFGHSPNCKAEFFIFFILNLNFQGVPSIFQGIVVGQAVSYQIFQYLLSKSHPNLAPQEFYQNTLPKPKMVPLPLHRTQGIYICVLNSLYQRHVLTQRNVTTYGGFHYFSAGVNFTYKQTFINSSQLNTSRIHPKSKKSTTLKFKSIKSCYISLCRYKHVSGIY